MMRLDQQRDLLRVARLDDVLLRAFLHGGDGGVHGGVGGDDDDRGLRVQPPDLHHGLDAVHAAGHLQVDEVDGVVARPRPSPPPRGRRRRCPRRSRPRAARRRAIRTSPLRRPPPESASGSSYRHSLGLAPQSRRAGRAECGMLQIDLPDVGGQRHGAAPVRAVHQPERVAGLVQRFLVSARSRKTSRLGGEPVEFLPQARQRDHAPRGRPAAPARRRRSAPG